MPPIDAAVLPTAELHIHIEGTPEPEMLVRLAARNGVTLPTTDIGELRRRYRRGRGLRRGESRPRLGNRAQRETPSAHMGWFVASCVIYKSPIAVDNCAECLCNGGWLLWATVAVDQRHGSRCAGQASRQASWPPGYRRIPLGLRPGHRAAKLRPVVMHAILRPGNFASRP